jgi:hypothetical protein
MVKVSANSITVRVISSGPEGVDVYYVIEYDGSIEFMKFDQIME